MQLARLIISLVLATSAALLMPPRRAALHTCRRASEDASVNAAEDDVDDAALAASLQVAAKRTSSARDALEKRRRREARPQRAVDAPQKPTLAMRDSRVKSSMEPQQELRELFDEGSWGALPESELLTRLGYLFAASFLVAVGLVDFSVEIKIRSARAIGATSARWRGGAGLSPLDSVSGAALSPRNDLVKNYRLHSTPLVDYRTGRLRPARRAI